MNKVGSGGGRPKTQEGLIHIADTTLLAATQRRLSHQTAVQVVQKARTYTWQAIDKIFELMCGKAGQITTVDKNGDVVVIDVEVPAAVQMKAAEALLDRGWGKAPQAIMLKTDSPLNLPEGEEKCFTVQEKIQMLLQAKLGEGGTTVDLEASELREVPEEKAEPKRVEPIEAQVAEEDPVLALI